MVSVCVVGGGTAGAAAAAEAASRGAEVTVVERSERPDPPWRSWPDMIRALRYRHGTQGPGWPALPDRTLIAEARSFSGGMVATSAGELHPDLVVISTGSSFELPKFRGYRLPGVVTLDSLRGYEQLGRESGSSGEIAVTGEGGRGLEVAERLSAAGRRVRLFVSRWQTAAPSPLVLDVISEAATKFGVSVKQGRVTRALGSGGVEAALVDGSVYACDALVFVPRRLPRTVRSTAKLGALGGYAVDRTLKTSVASVFAAGGCAELEGERSPRTFADEPVLSGRIAGFNCLGGGPSVGGARSLESAVFGLLWSRIETPGSWRPDQARLAAVSQRRGDSSACEIVFEARSKRVVSIETVEEYGSVGLSGLPVPPELSLRSLAYGLGSSDISQVPETARLGLTR